ncbi:unnamed protein product [Blepharisma stoltei]|uniref:non-specific serine/threonine protein kinase n=1 Tax=Blepharisma stoltei TaxID=1481888 RepID=A0AAU9JEC2_9CILI|nr:unnamed protein product [Blepharisma stoltei]
MGNICSQAPVAPQPTITVHRRILSAADIIPSPMNFVQENPLSFFSIYRLQSNPIGSGMYGEIRLCEHLRTGDVRAVKIITKAGLPQSVIENRSVLNEVNIMKTLDHPNILRIFEYFEDKSNYYLVMEYCKGGDLFDKVVSLTKFTEKQAARIMEQIFSGLQYLHNNGVTHRDMKPENIVIMDTNSDEELNIKIIDFDTATFFTVNGQIQGYFGTPCYMAPEVFKGKYNEKCDLWSCGVILYILLSGSAPFNGNDDDTIMKEIKLGRYEMSGEIWNAISDDAKDLISKLLVKNKAKRLSAAEAYNHHWCQKFHAENIKSVDITYSLGRIKAFRDSSKLKQAVQTFILSQVMSPSELDKYKNAFNAMDANGDGVISREELFNQLKTSMTENEAHMESDRIMRLVDSNNNGVIDYTEFLRATVEKRKMLTKENLHKAFVMFDKDESGVIEINELKEWLVGDAHIDENIIKELMKEFDKNSDGCIDLSEFEELVHSVSNN